MNRWASWLMVFLAGCGADPASRPIMTAEQGHRAGATPTVLAGPSLALAAAPASAAPAAGGNWGKITGRIVWQGTLPPVEKDGLCCFGNKDVTKDQDHCLAKGAIPEEDPIAVDKKSRGVLNVFAYLKDPPAIHPDYPQNKEAVLAGSLADFQKRNGVSPDDLQEAIGTGKVAVAKLSAQFMLDQRLCQYLPHAMAVREGQIVLVKNAEPIAHNVKVSGFSGRNDANPNMPPGTALHFEWLKEDFPLSIACVMHPWMKMYAMVFDHPYYYVTGQDEHQRDGSFVLDKVPAGKVTLILRNPRFIDPELGGKDTKKVKGKAITVAPGQTVNLGEIPIDASFTQ